MREYGRRMCLLLLMGMLIGILVPSGLVRAAQEGASEHLPELNEVQESLEEVLPAQESIGFEDYVSRLMTGEEDFSLQNLSMDTLDYLKKGWEGQKGLLRRLILLGLIAALFSNLAQMFRGHQLSETGFYVTYLLLFSSLTASFLSAQGIATRLLNDLLTFMKALVPAYSIAMTYSTGVSTGGAFYQIAMVLITVVDAILVHWILPAITIYFVLVVVAHLTSEDHFSRLTELLQQGIGWVMKTLLGVVIGFQTIQSMILPVADQVKRSTITRTVSFLPGVGSALSSVTETVVGSGILMRNAMGVTGIIVIVVICLIPLCRLAVLCLIYRLGAACIQPVSDKRIVNCMSGCATAAKMLLSVTALGAFLFILSITISCSVRG